MEGGGNAASLAERDWLRQTILETSQPIERWEKSGEILLRWTSLSDVWKVTFAPSKHVTKTQRYDCVTLGNFSLTCKLLLLVTRLFGVWLSEMSDKLGEF